MGFGRTWTSRAVPGINMKTSICTRPVVTTLVRTWAREVSSHSSEDPPVHNVHNKLNETEQRKGLFKSQSHPTVDKMIRVNQAGERAAVMIYAGQIAVLGKAQLGNLIQVSQSMCMAKTWTPFKFGHSLKQCSKQVITWLGSLA